MTVITSKWKFIYGDSEWPRIITREDLRKLHIFMQTQHLLGIEISFRQLAIALDLFPTLLG
jgi:hypothetical protein